jgi:hypothetical protein
MRGDIGKLLTLQVGSLQVLGVLRQVRVEPANLFLRALALAHFLLNDKSRRKQKKKRQYLADHNDYSRCVGARF